MKLHDIEYQVGDVVLTPSGRRAVVKKIMLGTSKTDAFDRIVVRYLDGTPRDLVTLQPHQLRLAPRAQVTQYAFEFA